MKSGVNVLGFVTALQGTLKISTVQTRNSSAFIQLSLRGSQPVGYV